MKAKKNQEMQKEAFLSVKNKMTELTGIPKDVALGIPVLTLTGQIELNVENFRGILEYTNVLVRIQYKNGQIKVNGRNLQIEYYTRDEMKLVGHIDSLEFVSRNQMNKNTF